MFMPPRSVHDDEANHREGKGEGESVKEAFDPDRALSATANCPTNKAHDETCDYGTDQQADAVKL